MVWSKLASDSWLIFRRSLREGFRNPALAFLFPLLPPLMGAVLFSQIFEKVVNLPGFPTDNYISWVGIGVVLLTAMSGAGFTATGLVLDSESGYLDRMRLLPVRSTAVLLGRLAFEAVRVLPAAAIVLVAAVALGADYDGGVLGAVAILGLVALWAMGWNSLFYVVALRTLNAQAPLALQPMFWPVFFFSTAMVPDEVMPDWIETVANFNPFTHILEAARMFMAGGLDWGVLALGLTVGIGFLVAMQLFAVRSLAALVQRD
jgi:ABC-2 type transport system permease protein